MFTQRQNAFCSKPQRHARIFISEFVYGHAETNISHKEYEIIEHLWLAVHIALTLWKILAEILKFSKLSVELLAHSAIKKLLYISAPYKTEKLLSTGWKTDCVTAMNN